MDFKHEIIGLKDQGDKNHVDENVSNHGNIYLCQQCYQNSDQQDLCEAEILTSST